MKEKGGSERGKEGRKDREEKNRERRKTQKERMKTRQESAAMAKHYVTGLERYCFYKTSAGFLPDFTSFTVIPESSLNIRF